MRVLSHFNRVQLFVIPWTVACQAPVHGFTQARILEWVAMPSSRGSSRPRDQNCLSCIAGRFFTTEPPGKSIQGMGETKYKMILEHPVLLESKEVLKEWWVHTKDPKACLNGLPSA